MQAISTLAYLFSVFRCLRSALCLLLMTITAMGFASAAAETLEELGLSSRTLDKGRQISFALDAAYLTDLENTLTVGQAIKQRGWQKTIDENPNLGFSLAGYWLAAKFQVDDLQTRWALRSRYALFDQFDVYVCSDTKVVSQEHCYIKKMGDRLPFDQRDINHPEFVAYLPFENTAPHWIFIRVRTEGSVPLMIRIADEKTTADSLILNFGLRGAYVAMMLIMGLYNLFLFFPTRDRSYLYYSGFVLSFLVFHLTYSGGLFFLAWPNHPDINGFALPLTFSVSMVFMALFISRFLNLKEHGRTSYYVFRLYLFIAFSLLIANGFLPYQTITKLINVLAIVMAISGIIIGARFWYSGLSSARLFTIAWVAFLTGLILASSRSLGLLPLNIHTLYGYQLGSLIEVLLLSLALGERITQLKKDKKASQEALLESQKESIKHLKNFEDLYNNSITGQFQLDRHLNLIKANPSWAKMVGITLSDIKNRAIPFNEFIASQEEVNTFWQQANSLGTLKNHVLHLQPNHSSETVIANITIRKGFESEEATWIGSAQDITESFNQEEALKAAQAERTQSLKQLVMGIAHEMNTPLGNIKMAQSFIRDGVNQLDADKRGPLQDGLNIVEDGAETLRELGQLMKTSVVVDQEWHNEETDLAPWLETWSKHVKQQYSDLILNVTVKVDSTPQISQLALDSILNHFIMNSVSHNTERYQDRSLKISLSVSEDSHGITFAYEDNGKGLDAETKHDIFQPFYTTKRQAAKNKGLGLYQTYNLITEVLHGTIALPKTESGFAIQFTLPQQA